MSLSAVGDTPFALSSFRGMLTLVLDFSYFSSFQCSFVWEQLTGQFLSSLVHSTHLWHFLGQPSFPFLCFRRDFWLRGHLRKSCENAVLGTWDGEVWEKCNNFIGEKHIKRCTTHMGEGKISSSQSWAWIKSVSSSFLKPKLWFCPLNWIIISWTAPNWMQKSRRVWILLNIICECRSQTMIKMLGSDVLQFDFIFAGLHTYTVSLTSAERCLFCIFLWIKSVHCHIQIHTLVCDENMAATLQ